MICCSLSMSIIASYVNLSSLRYNAEILRQFSTYSDEYRKECNSFKNKSSKCILCVAGNNCEVCQLKTRFKTELQLVVDSNERYRLNDIAAHLQSRSNIEMCLKRETLKAKEESKSLKKRTE